MFDLYILYQAYLFWAYPSEMTDGSHVSVKISEEFSDIPKSCKYFLYVIMMVMILSTPIFHTDQINNWNKCEIALLSTKNRNWTKPAQQS